MYILIAWLIVVTLLSVLPVGNSALAARGMDKAVHFCVYAVTSALTYGAISRWALKWRSGTVIALLASVVLASAYGLGMELLQGALKHRMFSLWDAAFNALGAVTAAGLIALARALRARGSAGEISPGEGRSTYEEGN